MKNNINSSEYWLLTDTFMESLSDISQLQVQAIDQSIEDFGTVNLGLIDFSQKKVDNIEERRAKKVLDFLKMLNYFRANKKRDELINRY